MPPQECHAPAERPRRRAAGTLAVMAAQPDQPRHPRHTSSARPSVGRRDGEPVARRRGGLRVRLRRLHAGAGQRRDHPGCPIVVRRRADARLRSVRRRRVQLPDPRQRLTRRADRGRAGPVRDRRGHRRLEPFGRDHARPHRPAPAEGDRPVVPAGPVGGHPGPRLRQDQLGVLGRSGGWRRAARRQDGRGAERAQDQPRALRGPRRVPGHRPGAGRRDDVHPDRHDRPAHRARRPGRMPDARRRSRRSRTCGPGTSRAT